MISITGNERTLRTPERTKSGIIQYHLVNTAKVLFSLFAAAVSIYFLWESTSLLTSADIPLNLVHTNDTRAIDPETGVRPYSRGNWLPYTWVTLVGITLSALPNGLRPLSGLGQGIVALGWLVITHIGIFFRVGFAQLNSLEGLNECFYETCWPMKAQLYLASVPIGVTAVAMLIMATVARTRHWAWRIGVPVVTFLACLSALAALWDVLLLPWLTGPPPNS